MRRIFTEENGEEIMKWSSHPLIYEVNTWAWLNFLSKKFSRKITLSNVPEEVFLHDFAPFDAIWLMGVWTRSPAGITIGKNHPGLLAEYNNALPDFTSEDVMDSIEDWDHFNKAYETYYDAEVAKSDALPKGACVGKLFTMYVADGQCWYEVVKVFKTKIHLKLRGDLCLDGYCDHHFRGGGSFARWEVEEKIDMRDAMAAILNKQKK